jgi:hypothetical protein
MNRKTLTIILVVVLAQALFVGAMVVLAAQSTAAKSNDSN